MNRSAPEAGYRAGFKPMQRKQVWHTLTDGIVDKPNKQVLILPSAEGDEIGWCETKGFRRQNIHCVDRNPAIVAHLQRRYPGIQTYGVELGKAAERIRRKGLTIDVANLDLCGPVTDTLMGVLDEMSRNRTWSSHARVAVTILRGREQRDCFGSAMRSGAAEEITTDESRRTCIGVALSGGLAESFSDPTARVHYETRLMRTEIYKSAAGSQTMLWMAFALLDRECVDFEVSELRKLASTACEHLAKSTDAPTRKWWGQHLEGIVSLIKRTDRTMSLHPSDDGE